MKPADENRLLQQFSWFEARNVWTGKKLGFPTPCSFESGWFTIIYNCLKEIDELYKNKKANIKNLRIDQLKEKYGCMRIYLGNYIDGVDEIVNKYEEKSYETCEICGSIGSLKHRGSWYKTLCSTCAEEQGYIDFENFENKDEEII